jgi:hypothetical protein
VPPDFQLIYTLFPPFDPTPTLFPPFIETWCLDGH